MQSSVSLLLAVSALLAPPALTADASPPQQREKSATSTTRQVDFIAQAEPPRAQQGRGPRPTSQLTPQRQAQRTARDLFAHFDEDQNGKLELTEIPDAHRQMFQRALKLRDQDADDALSLRELAEALAQLAVQDRTRPADNRSERGPEIERNAEASRDNGPVSVRVGVLFQTLDANHDGNISAAEIQSAPKRLTKLDRNGDGELSIRELLEQTRPITIQIDRLPASPQRQQD